MNAAFSGMASSGLQNPSLQVPLPSHPPSQPSLPAPPPSQPSTSFAPPSLQAATAIAPPGQPPGLNLASSQQSAGPSGQSSSGFSLLGMAVMPQQAPPPVFNPQPQPGMSAQSAAPPPPPQLGFGSQNMVASQQQVGVAGTQSAVPGPQQLGFGIQSMAASAQLQIGAATQSAVPNQQQPGFGAQSMASSQQQVGVAGTQSTAPVQQQLELAPQSVAASGQQQIGGAALNVAPNSQQGFASQNTAAQGHQQTGVAALNAAPIQQQPAFGSQNTVSGQQQGPITVQSVGAGQQQVGFSSQNTSSVQQATFSAPSAAASETSGTTTAPTSWTPAPATAPIGSMTFRPGPAPWGPPFQPPAFSPIGATRPGLVGPPGQFSSQFSTVGAFSSVTPQSGYTASPAAPSQMMPPGVLGSAPVGMVPRFPAPTFSPVARQPIFTPRPPLGVPPVPLQRPPVSGMRLVPPVLKPPLVAISQDATIKISNPVVSSEKPHTTVYVGKIASTVEDDFLKPLLELCGPVRSWKRAQDPTTGSPKGFGFCEFDTAEGVLRALRLLNKYCLDGQELVLNVNQATREYLERYVTLKKERERLLKERAQEDDKEEELAPGVEKTPTKPSISHLKDSSIASADTEIDNDGKKFGLVNDADRKGDDYALEKLKTMMEERALLKPLPPPPALPATSELVGKSSSALEGSVKSRDGDSNFEETRSDDAIGKMEDETTSENKNGLDLERPGTSGSERGRRTERDRERDREREMERELERFERERERERARRERDREVRIREAERLYEDREREWENREREKERQRLHDKEREKERERDRRREVKEQEEESDDDDRRKRHYRGSHQEELRRRRQREREDDLVDRLREEQEIAEAKRRKIEEPSNAVVKMEIEGSRLTSSSKREDLDGSSYSLRKRKGSVSAASESESDDAHDSKSVQSNGVYDARRDGEVENSTAITDNDQKPNSSSAPRKLGFGIIGSGRRASVPSVFHQEEDEDAPKDRKLRPLVPIDYSAEELQAVPTQSKSSSKLAPNLVAAAEFAKSLSNLGNATSPGNDDRKRDGDRDKSRRISNDRNRRERDREKERDRERAKEWDREKEKPKEKERERDARAHEKEQNMEKANPPENRNILDAKQLIDTLPKTKEELFAYPVDWSIYDKHNLHARMRPWISKKITDFLGEEETTLVDFIVKNTQNHLTAANMLELLEAILDDEAEMFVLKMWRMLIFEIRRIETGLAFRPKS